MSGGGAIVFPQKLLSALKKNVGPVIVILQGDYTSINIDFVQHQVHLALVINPCYVQAPPSGIRCLGA